MAIGLLAAAGGIAAAASFPSGFGFGAGYGAGVRSGYDIIYPKIAPYIQDIINFVIPNKGQWDVTGKPEDMPKQIPTDPSPSQPRGKAAIETAAKSPEAGIRADYDRIQKGLLISHAQYQKAKAGKLRWPTPAIARNNLMKWSKRMETFLSNNPDFRV